MSIAFLSFLWTSGGSDMR